MARTDLPVGHKLSMAGEDYLEAIYRLATLDGEEQNVRSVDIAEQLGVSKASVSKALSTLRDAGMVKQARYGRVALTDEGRAYAKKVWHSHRTLRAFLTETLGVDAQVADDEACLMEHYLSEDTVDRLCAYLQHEGYSIKG